MGVIGQSHAQSKVESEVTDVGEARIDVRSQGSRDVLVVLCGVGAEVSHLDAFVRTVTNEGLRVLAINPRGAGGSRGPLADLSLTDYAEDDLIQSYTLPEIPLEKPEKKCPVLSIHCFASVAI